VKSPIVILFAESLETVYQWNFAAEIFSGLDIQGSYMAALEQVLPIIIVIIVCI